MPKFFVLILISHLIWPEVGLGSPKCWERFENPSWLVNLGELNALFKIAEKGHYPRLIERPFQRPSTISSDREDREYLSAATTPRTALDDLRQAATLYPYRYERLKVLAERSDHPRLLESLAWLKIAIDSDLESARKLSLLESVPGVVAYHSQQAVEKALKAVLIFNGVVTAPQARKIGHKLNQLLNKVSIGIANPPVIAWIELTVWVASIEPCATRYRYPEPDCAELSPYEAANVHQMASTIVGIVLESMLDSLKHQHSQAM